MGLVVNSSVTFQKGLTFLEVQIPMYQTSIGLNAHCAMVKFDD